MKVAIHVGDRKAVDICKFHYNFLSLRTIFLQSLHTFRVNRAKYSYEENVFNEIRCYIKQICCYLYNNSTKETDFENVTST
jgi:hypothetical protein